MSLRTTHDGSGLVTMGCFLIVVVFNITIGYLSVQYLLATLLGQTAHWFVALVGGLFLGQVTAPLAVAVWILQSVGVNF